MKILIGADIVPTDSNIQFFESGNAVALVGHDLLQRISDPSNYSIFNLEVPLCDIITPISKRGRNLVASSKAITGYKALGVNLFTLANNHILDQGKQGIQSTREVLYKNNIHYVGIGETPEDAAKPYIFNFAGRKIGVYACAEHEFSIVGVQSEGANPFDPLETPDHIVALKKQCDYVIVLYHGGKEHYRYPSPNLQKVCRKLVDKGADLIVCQHSHCVGCEEKYAGGTIVYGQGNFLFDQSDHECWQTGLLIQLDSEMNVTYLPLIKKGNVIRMATHQDAKDIVDGFEKRSIEIQNPGVIEQKYAEFSKQMVNGYLYRLRGKFSLVFRVLNKLSGYRLLKWSISKKYQQKEKLSIQNIIECESHRELFLQGLKQRQG